MTLNRRKFLGAAIAAPVSLSLGGLAAFHATPALASAGGQGNLPGLYQFKIGTARVTALLDGHLPVQNTMFNSFDADKAAEKLVMGNYGHLDAMKIPVSGYLIEQEGSVILVDTGAANTMGPGLGGLHGALAATGVAPAQVDTILLTHLHLDHVGGLIDAKGQALFPNAEIVTGQTEWDFWHNDGIMASVPADMQNFFHIARISTAPYKDRMRLFQGEQEVAKGLTSVPMPGHTPGHAGFQLSSGDDTLLVWGDLIHSTALQFAYPEWTVLFDADPVATVETRRRVLDRAAADRIWVAGMHVDFPGLGKVQRDGSAYRYQIAPWQAAL